MTPDIQRWNEQGFIPGPQELKKDFVKRVHFCLHLQTELSDQVGVELPFNFDDQASNEIKQSALDQTRQLYGMAPAWVPIFFNNYHLAPWHGGCAWIFKLTEETPTAAFLQLRACFREKKSFLGLYDREELISHELAHVGRMMFEEPQFEELLAYRSSSSKWRQILGPIVQSSRESLYFMLLLCFIVLANLTFTALWPTLIPAAVISLALGRLFYRRTIFNRCLQHLQEICSEPEHLIYRLTDEEIHKFSKLSPLKIKEFVRTEPSYRWEFLRSVYTERDSKIDISTEANF